MGYGISILITIILNAMRKKYLVGNWKMNTHLEEAEELIKNLSDSEKIEIIIAPSYLYLKEIGHITTGLHIHVGAQNMHFADRGAFSGEVSPTMLLDINCHNVIIGHSERRYIFGETDELINKKNLAAYTHGMYTTFCVGETRTERENGNAEKYIADQIRKGLNGVQEIDKVTIAYEPVWAIGSGIIPSRDQISDIHKCIRRTIDELYGEGKGEEISVIYGGSVKPENAEYMLEENEIDGFIVGGASLDAKSFNSLIGIIEESV